MWWVCFVYDVGLQGSVPFPEFISIHEEELSARCDRALCFEPVLLEFLSPCNFAVGFLFIEWVVCIWTVARCRVANQYDSSRRVVVAVFAGWCVVGLLDLGTKVWADKFSVRPVSRFEEPPACIRDDGCADPNSKSLAFSQEVQPSVHLEGVYVQ